MGVTKQYLRVEAKDVFGLVASPRSNIVLLKNMKGNVRQAAVGACENVIIWDLLTKEKVQILKGDKHEVSRVAKTPDDRHLAVGYMDGSIRVFEVVTGEIKITFQGHRSAVTALAYDHDGLRLVSGSKDTDVIVWDVVSESGLFRLKGHKGEVTKVEFLKERNVLLTSSKDTFVKFWDLDTQHCFCTLTGHRTEVYGFVLINSGQRLITGSADSELRVWDITYTEEYDGDDDEESSKPKRQRPDNNSEEDEDELNILHCHPVGSVMRHGRDRVVCLTTDPTDRYLVCHGLGNSYEVFIIASDAELKKKLAKRRKKARLQQQKDEALPEPSLTLQDQVRHMNKFKMSSKMRWIDVSITSPEQLQVVGLLNNNKLEVVDLQIDVTSLQVIFPVFEFFDARSTLHCFRTLACDYALCSVFSPGDRYVIIGTKSGRLQVFDVDEGTMIENIDAHSGAIWSLSLAPDKRGLVTGSADHTVKFWNFELVSVSENSSGRKQLSLIHTRTLQMDEDVLCVRYSPDQRLLAVALLDNTVKVFFVDTLKFFLSLYGHKLPVLCMDISSDSTLIVTGSADRNVKIWGLDFGDCHRSLFAHDDSILCIQFVPRTHMFYTASKDNKVKQWDADNFENIITLHGHHGEVWALAVSPNGKSVVTSSHDHSLRLWEKTEELLVLEEEREMEREKEYEESAAQDGEPVIPGETNDEFAHAGKKNIETVKAAEKLIEAVEVYKEETQKLAQHKAQCQAAGKQLPAPTPHPLLVAYHATSPSHLVLQIIRKIKSSELDESLLVLPFAVSTDLLSILETFLSNGWETELTSRCLLFLLRIHHGQVTSTQVLLPTIDRLRPLSKERADHLKDTVGFNLMGLQMLRLKLEEKKGVKVFADATSKFKERIKKKRKAVLTIVT
ncbi:hypothetical protein C0Q70_10605 [Pomacea canaliculata]|uniref:Small-subunit processome Utp12 domain-containing protein n=1 Tax=Pomacea canaliculata TaxID=400727 RepID=A0A2T7P3M3_POMCA|nr:hypothetical protein C0Q70_10605 [Pomacea canaliculata]